MMSNTAPKFCARYKFTLFELYLIRNLMNNTVCSQNERRAEVSLIADIVGDLLADEEDEHDLLIAEVASALCSDASDEEADKENNN